MKRAGARVCARAFKTKSAGCRLKNNTSTFCAPPLLVETPAALAAAAADADAAQSSSVSWNSIARPQVGPRTRARAKRRLTSCSKQVRTYVVSLFVRDYTPLVFVLAIAAPTSAGAKTPAIAGNSSPSMLAPSGGIFPERIFATPGGATRHLLNHFHACEGLRHRLDVIEADDMVGGLAIVCCCCCDTVVVVW